MVAIPPSATRSPERSRIDAEATYRDTNHQRPITRGWIQTTFRYYKGKKLGPYYVRRWKEGKRIFKEYIRFEDLERIRAECDAYRRQKEQGRMHGRWVTNVAGNLNYVRRMCRWAEQGKLRIQDLNFVRRLKKEGFDIFGRPPTRRRVTRQYAQIEGRMMIVKTVFELDGTSRVFVAPLSVNDPLEELKQNLLDAWEATHGTQSAAPQHVNTDERTSASSAKLKAQRSTLNARRLTLITYI